MTNKNSTFILKITLFSLLIVSCKYQYEIPEGLRKLTAPEMIARAEREDTTPKDVKIIMYNGKPFDNNAIAALNGQKLVPELYIDSSKIVKIILLRKATVRDQILLAKLDEIHKKAEEIKLVDVDCNSINKILSSVYDNDQGPRNSGLSDTRISDRKNQQLVLSIINKCGFPRPPITDSQGFLTIFLVIQHGSKDMRTKYFKDFKDLSEHGHFDKGIVVLMEDRILMDAGKKQKFGTQVIKNQYGKWELYPVDNPDSLDRRRKEIGLKPIQEYLKGFNSN